MTTGRTTAAGVTVPRRTLRRGWVGVLGLALVVQLVVLYVPSAPGPPGPPGLDKLIHAAVFAAPTIAALSARLPGRWVVGVLALHAPVSELVQAGLLPHRDGSVWDVVADLTGVLLALAVHVAWRRTRH